MKQARHILYLGSVEIAMSQRTPKVRPAREKTFAPEADGVFELVDERHIAEMRERLNEEYGIGQGRLVSLDAQDAAR